jgi:predicted O-linked N-acetylglucosamine transferase (SPINDLY family)
MSGINCVSYIEQNRFDADQDFWARRGTDSRFMLEGMDLEVDLGPAPQRATYGIPENAIVMATCGADLDASISDEFCDMMINILRAHPHAVYLLIGEGELSAQKRKFESAGVGKRVGYAGKRKDLPGFLRIADLYLAEFPCSSATGVLQAMACERPVVAMRWGEASGESQAAAFIGADACISNRDTPAYIERVSKLIREGTTRAKLGKQMRARVEQHFGYNQTAKHVEQLCEQVLQACCNTSGGMTSQDDQSDSDSGPIAQVA